MVQKNKLGFTQEQQEEINSIVRYYNISNYTKNLNRVVFSGIEGHKHAMAKCNLCYLLYMNNIPFITEIPIGKNRPDILVLKPVVGIEILSSEKLKSFEAKVNKALNGLFLVSISAERGTNIKDIYELL